MEWNRMYRNKPEYAGTRRNDSGIKLNDTGMRRNEQEWYGNVQNDTKIRQKKPEEHQNKAD